MSGQVRRASVFPLRDPYGNARNSPLRDPQGQTHKGLLRLLAPGRTNQHAFRKPAASTTMAMLQITDNFVTFVRRPCDLWLRSLISLDFSKAFDRIDHASLLPKISASGLQRGFILWLSSYLLNCNFRVKIHSQLSSSHRAYSGVPQ